MANITIFTFKLATMIRTAIFISAFLMLSFTVPPKGTEDGAWEITSFIVGDYNHSNATGILVMENNYYSWAVYTKESHEFIGTGGGTYKKGGNTAEFNVLFHTLAPEMVGKRIIFARRGGDSKWILESTQGIRFELKKMKEKIDESLEGTWRVTERDQNGEMVAMPDSARRSFKFLSKSRFQWGRLILKLVNFLVRVEVHTR